LSIFAPKPLKFSLNRDRVPILPLLTTKRVFLRAVIAELLWFIEGSTCSTPLSEAGVKIWDGNGSREFLDKVGLSHREVGDLGPVYGFQWRHFGAEYVDAKTDYTGQGVDQLADVIHKLKSNPYDRRIVMSAVRISGDMTCPFGTSQEFGRVLCSPDMTWKVLKAPGEHQTPFHRVEANSPR
jgi:thymidylate synthase